MIHYRASVARAERADPVVTLDDPKYVKALAHPLRIRILALLAERDASPVQLLPHLDATLGTVAYHVRLLEKLGLVEEVDTRQRRGATEHVFRARPPLISDEAWAAASPMTKQVFASAALGQVAQFANQSAMAGGFERADAHITRSTLKVDEQGWSALAEASKRWLAEIYRIQADAAERLGASPDDGLDVGAVIMVFEALPFFAAPPVNGQDTAPDDAD